tara:strand:- start:49 stop:429 length:381 start_codon:yes stop_codon:yes gene_type:complete
VGITHYTVYETSSGKILRGVGVRSIEELTSSISEQESYIEGEYFNYEKVIDGVAVPFNNALDIEEAKNRSIRERAFFRSDWTQGIDSPLSDSKKVEWATYRQALRDITSHSNWPNLEDEDWPTEPS